MTQIVSVRSTSPGGYNVKTPGKQTCVFLDRDGVLNKTDGFSNTPEQWDALMMPEQIKALARLTNEPGITAVVVTNQGGIASGKMTEETNNAILQRLAQRVEEAGGDLDAIYFCPNGNKEEAPAGQINGRKPEAGMLIQAAKDFGDQIDLADSWMVGDMTTDIGAGKAAGVETVLVETGFAGKDGKWKGIPDHTVADFSAAVDYILAHR